MLIFRFVGLPPTVFPERLSTDLLEDATAGRPVQQAGVEEAKETGEENRRGRRR